MEPSNIMKQYPPIPHDEIARLAYLNWEKEGCPSGRDQDYWLEAEQQLRATKHMVMAEHQPAPVAATRAPGKNKPGKNKKIAPGDINPAMISPMGQVARPRPRAA